VTAKTQLRLFTFVGVASSWAS